MDGKSAENAGAFFQPHEKYFDADFSRAELAPTLPQTDFVFAVVY